MIDTGLNGKVALVTGGNNPLGIGAATAKALAAQGAEVFIHYYRPPSEPHDADDADLGSSSPSAGRGERSPQGEASDEHGTPGIPLYYAMQMRTADAVVEAIRGDGGQAACWEADLADPAVASDLFDRAERELGPVEVLVNNAADYQADTFLPSEPGDTGRALWDDGPLTTTVSADSHDRHFAVNSRAVALMMAEYLRRHIDEKRSWGRVVNVSADLAAGSPGEISYRASKYALESYSRAAAAELGAHGITVNVVSPGPIQTGYISAEIERALLPEIPLGRVGRPEDVADAIVFLASEQAAWITGQVLLVHGGHRLIVER